MKRKVVVAKKLAEHLLALKAEANQSGRGLAFRQAWATLWDALQDRPLPPDDNATVFGEPLFRTKHAPVHLICLGCARPLAAQFATCEAMVVVAGVPTSPAFLLRVWLMAAGPH